MERGALIKKKKGTHFMKWGAIHEIQVSIKTVINKPGSIVKNKIICLELYFTLTQ